MKMKFVHCLAVAVFMFLRSAEGELSQYEKWDLLAAHNNVRGNVRDPKATNMLEMKWSDELARDAQEYSGKCIWKHDSKWNRKHRHPYKRVGENLYMHTGRRNVTRATKKWGDEVHFWNFWSGSCLKGKKCGHYTQMVWAISDHVGCGMTRCQKMWNKRVWRNAYYIVCRYGPGGNLRRRHPYITGKTCSSCPNRCRAGLCLK